jgi:hypothetical protein
MAINQRDFSSPGKRGYRTSGFRPKRDLSGKATNRDLAVLGPEDLREIAFGTDISYRLTISFSVRRFAESSGRMVRICVLRSNSPAYALAHCPFFTTSEISSSVL